MSTLCGCGHDMERHNDKTDEKPFVDGWFGGNCRMCGCKGFVSQKAHTVPGDMLRCTKHDYVHISDWGCPHCYKEAFKPGVMIIKEKPEGMDEAVGLMHDLRHLNEKIDSLQGVLGEIYLLSQHIEEGKWEAYSDERRLRRVYWAAKKELWDD